MNARVFFKKALRLMGVAFKAVDAEVVDELEWRRLNGMNNGIYSLETEVEGSKVKEVARGRRKSKMPNQ